MEFLRMYEEVKQRLTASGLKATQQRIVIYEALLKLNNHPTVDAVYAFVRPTNPSISLGTVYKTLNMLVSGNLARRVLTDDGCMRYDALTQPHSHIYCTNTGEIIDFTDATLHQVIEEFLQRCHIRNLKIKDVSVQINGEKINPDESIAFN